MTTMIASGVVVGWAVLGAVAAWRGDAALSIGWFQLSALWAIYGAIIHKKR